MNACFKGIPLPRSIIIRPTSARQDATLVQEERISVGTFDVINQQKGNKELTSFHFFLNKDKRIKILSNGILHRAAFFYDWLGMDIHPSCCEFSSLSVTHCPLIIFPLATLNM